MATGYTIFLTYQLSDAPFTASTSFGYGRSLHCAYVKSITTDTLENKVANIYFSSVDGFRFLNNTSSINATGFSATYFYGLIQVVSGVTDNNITIKPAPESWKIIDLTSQISNHTIGQRIEITNLIDTLFAIDIPTLSGQTTYNLSYLNYPTDTDDTLGGYLEENFKLSFGEEVFFFGNVKTDIRATAYTTDIPITLPLNEFNSSTNPTWNEESVYITEVGIYNNNGDLVAIGKLNNPIEKNSNISRTILFAIDF